MYLLFLKSVYVIVKDGLGPIDVMQIDFVKKILCRPSLLNVNIAGISAVPSSERRYPKNKTIIKKKNHRPLIFYES